MTTKIDELKALMAKATPGPWKALDGLGSFRPSVYSQNGSIATLTTRQLSANANARPVEQARADCSLIAESRNTLPELIAAVEAMKELVDLNTFDALQKARVALAPFGE